MNPSRSLQSRLAIPCFCLALLSFAPAARAVAPRSIVDGDYDQFSQGELQSAALTSDGFLIPSYARRKAGDSGQEIVWDAVREASGSYLCATGHSGRLVRIDDKGTTKSLAKTADKELTAMVKLADGTTLVAGAPSGRIYRLGTDDQLTTAATLHTGIVWRMTLDSKGDVWAATGPEGRLYRMHPSGDKLDVKEIAKLHSSNLLDLWIDADGKMGKAGDIYVAGQDPGWLYRVSADGKSTDVAFNSQAEEVRAIAPFAEGLALALNTERAPTSQALGLALRASGGGISAANDRSSGAPATPPPAPPPGGADQGGAASLTQAFAPSRRGGLGQPRSEVVVLSREGFVRQLWTAQDRPIHSLAPSPAGGLLAASGSQGRLFEIQPTGEFAVVADTREDFLLRIVADDRGYLIGGARNGALYVMDRKRASEAIFLSRAIDARLPVEWGHFYLSGDLAKGQKVKVAFRTGNDGDVDSKFWSEWTDDQTAELDQPVDPPKSASRFIQYRLKIQGDGDESLPRIDQAEQFYIEPNAAPMIRMINAQDGADIRRPAGARGSGPGGGASSAVPTPPSGGAGGAASAAGAGGRAGAENEREPRSNTMQVRVDWQAQDPNGDPLRYALYFKGENEKEWKLIEKDLAVTQMTVDIGGVADGRYRFRVVASDELGNPPGKELKSEKISDAIVVDNTPPVINSLTASVRGARATIRAEATDDLSVLSTAKIDIDNGDGLPLIPVDGLMDERTEKFEFQTEELKPGEHVATLVATDRRGNSSVKKVLFTVDKP